MEVILGGGGSGQAVVTWRVKKPEGLGLSNVETKKCLTWVGFRWLYVLSCIFLLDGKNILRWLKKHFGMILDLFQVFLFFRKSKNKNRKKKQWDPWNIWKSTCFSFVNFLWSVVLLVKPDLVVSEVLGSDLTTEYVKINADYRSWVASWFRYPLDNLVSDMVCCFLLASNF